MAVKAGAEKEFGRIGVLMGGPSSEREISLKSGKAVYEALRSSGIKACIIDVKTAGRRENIRLIKSHKINCAFIALHGRFGEDGQIQRILEILKIPYTGSGVLASRLAMNKIASRRIFQRHGLRVPRYKVIDKNSYHRSQKVRKSLGLPLVIKPASAGSSIGLSIIDKEEGLCRALELAFAFDKKAIIEEYIRGRELTVGILDDIALAIIEITPKKRYFDFEAKYQPGLTSYVVPARLEDRLAGKIRAQALSAHRLLGCFGCSRVDMILNQEGLPFILELNSIPGLTNTSLLPRAAKAVGIEFNELCLKLIKLAYEKK